MVHVKNNKVELDGSPRELCIDLACLVASIYGVTIKRYGEKEAKRRMQNAIGVGFAYKEKENEYFYCNWQNRE